MHFLLKVSRPRFWFYIFGPYIVGLVSAFSDQAVLTNDHAWFALYFLWSANLLIYGVNDIFDYDTDKLNPKKIDYEGLVTPEKRSGLVTAICILNIPFLIKALFFTNLSAAISAIGFLFFSVFYSAPPIRAKAKPFLDSAFNILYVLPGVFAYSLVTGEFPPAMIVVAAGCWTAAMHAYSAIPDIEADKAAGLKTIATVLGPYGTLAACAILYAAPAILSFEYLGIASVTLGGAYILLMLASVVSYRSGRLFKLYRAFPLINIAAGFVIFWSIALEKLL